VIPHRIEAETENVDELFRIAVLYPSLEQEIRTSSCGFEGPLQHLGESV